MADSFANAKTCSRVGVPDGASTGREFLKTCSARAASSSSLIPFPSLPFYGFRVGFLFGFLLGLLWNLGLLGFRQIRRGLSRGLSRGFPWVSVGFPWVFRGFSVGYCLGFVLLGFMLGFGSSALFSVQASCFRFRLARYRTDITEALNLILFFGRVKRDQ